MVSFGSTLTGLVSLRIDSFGVSFVTGTVIFDLSIKSCICSRLGPILSLYNLLNWFWIYLIHAVIFWRFAASCCNCCFNSSISAVNFFSNFYKEHESYFIITSRSLRSFRNSSFSSLNSMKKKRLCLKCSLLFSFAQKNQLMNKLVVLFSSNIHQIYIIQNMKKKFSRMSFYTSTSSANWRNGFSKWDSQNGSSNTIWICSMLYLKCTASSEEVVQLPTFFSFCLDFLILWRLGMSLWTLNFCIWKSMKLQ